MATLYCLREDILSYDATWSAAAGTPDSAFPLTNLNNVRPWKVLKFTGTTGTARGTIASTAIQAVAVINCNRPGASLTITNGGGMSAQTLAIPSTLPSGAPSINGWKDLRAATTAGTAWDTAIPTGSGNAAVGKILLIATLREMPIRWSARMREIRNTRVYRTGYGIPLGNKKNTRYRELTANLSRESYRGSYETLRRSSSGPNEPFFFVLEEGVNDPMYVWFPKEDWEHTRESRNRTEWTDMLEELNPGLAL